MNRLILNITPVYGVQPAPSMPLPGLPAMPASLNPVEITGYNVSFGTLFYSVEDVMAFNKELMIFLQKFKIEEIGE